MTAKTSALTILRSALGPTASFRTDQLQAIEALVEKRGRVLVVQRTGWGKSVVYFVATRLRRNTGAGPTILISPLLSLMRDQVRMATGMGVRAVTMNSGNEKQWPEIEAQLVNDEVDLLLISPERLLNERFRTVTLPSIKHGIGLFVVDEAHCVSDWGHDFRPSYRRIERLVQALPANVPLLATTATANDRVIQDVENQLGPDLQVFRGPLGRDSLRLQIVRLEDQAERLAWLVEYLRTAQGSGIIYALTVGDTERVSRWLANHGIDAPAYHGKLTDDSRRALEGRLRENDLKALVATVALGMGFDKPDLAFVVHYQRPGSTVTYYQEIGRAGRDIQTADVVLLAGQEDDAIAKFFIDGAFPSEQTMRDVLAAIESIDTIDLAQLEAQVNVSRGTLKRTLLMLEVDGAIVREASRWSRTANSWTPDTARMTGITAARNRELRRMQDFVETDACLMRFVTNELDDETEDLCERCANCVEPFVATTVADSQLVLDASRFLRRSWQPIEPRKRWAPGVKDGPLAIPMQHQLREGRVLSTYGDAGFGRLVRAGKYADGQFAEALVEAVALMIQEDLPIDDELTWVTAVPSRRSAELVPSFARRLADHLGLPYRSALVKQHDTEPQKQMANGPHQATNVHGAFAAVHSEVLPGSVFLIDDLVDSRWTLTACGVALAEAGSGPVYPVALGQTSPGVSR